MRYATGEPQPPPRVARVAGLDLGKTSDYSALVVLERKLVGQEPATYAADYIHRWPLGTSYPEIVDGVARVLKSDVFARSRSCLVVDATGVGMPVVDMFRRADLGPRHGEPEYQEGSVWNAWGTRVVPVIITGGHRSTCEHGTWHVPKRVLVSSTQVALQNGRIKIASQLPEAEALARELQDFQLTVSESANDTYGGRAGAHDDLVLALALAIWWAGVWQEPEPPPRSFSTGMFAPHYYEDWRGRR